MTMRGRLLRNQSTSFVCLWFAAVLFYVVGDTYTTYIILTSPYLVEANPVIKQVFTVAGLGGIILLKCVAVSLLSVVTFYASIEPINLVLYYAPVFLLFLVGFTVTVVNSLAILRII